VLFRTRPAAEPSPAVRARLAALFGTPPPPVVDAAPDPPGEPPRVDPGPRGALALACVAVLAIAVTGVVVWRGRPRAVEVPPPRVVVSAPAPSAALLVVDVAGDVREPGLVRLPPGSRVADALTAAGGLRRGATTDGLNLARRLVDGEQVLVGAPTAASPGAAQGGLLDLNAATADQLDDLPGIGPVLADRIVEWRTAHGPFTTVDQLREVSGIGARKYESIQALVTV
jgi:competence protein ComEA